MVPRSNGPTLPGTVIARPASEPSIGAVRKTSPLICSGAEPDRRPASRSPRGCWPGTTRTGLVEVAQSDAVAQPADQAGRNEIAMSLMRWVRSSRVMELTAVVEAPAVAGSTPAPSPA